MQNLCKFIRLQQYLLEIPLSPQVLLLEIPLSPQGLLLEIPLSLQVLLMEIPLSLQGVLLGWRDSANRLCIPYIYMWGES